MTTPCDYCGAPADWRRPPAKGLTAEGFRCDAHTPAWRVAEFEALTLVAKARKEAKDAADLPRPAMAPEKPEPKTPAKPKQPRPPLTKAEADALIDRAVERSRTKPAPTKAPVKKGRR